MKNYSDLRGCYPPQSSASADNALQGLQNSSYVILKLNSIMVDQFIIIHS